MLTNFIISFKVAFLTLVCVAAKYFAHYFEIEFIAQSSLHTAVVSSAIFVIGFLLSTTINDYKESERIPSDFSANLEDMYLDAESIHRSYPKFNLNGFRKQLIKITEVFNDKTRRASHGVSDEILKLSAHFAQMESAGVPPNFVVKLKQQQTQLLRLRKRVAYIQTIHSIPSATILARTIILFVVLLLIFTNIDPYKGSLVIVGIISYVMIYMMLLIQVIGRPFHKEGKTKDDVSMFQLEETGTLLRDFKSKTNSARTSIRSTRSR